MLYRLAVSGVIIVLDQVTKYYAERLLELHIPIGVVPYLNLTLTYNTGAAFSFLSDAGGWQRWFFSLLSVVVSAFIVLWIRRLGSRDLWLSFALALVLGGALGNLCDRVRLGAVVDFIDVYYESWHFPAFNMADSAISIGAVMLLLTAFRGEPQATSSSSDGPTRESN
jgi:signal peptidase II